MRWLKQLKEKLNQWDTMMKNNKTHKQEKKLGKNKVSLSYIPLSWKQNILFGILLLVNFSSAYFAYRSSSRGIKEIASTKDTRIPTALFSKNAQIDLQEVRSNLLGYMVAGQPQYIEGFRKANSRFKQNLLEMKEGDDAHILKLVNEVDTIHDKLEPLMQKLFVLRSDPLRNRLPLREYREIAEPLLLSIKETSTLAKGTTRKLSRAQLESLQKLSTFMENMATVDPEFKDRARYSELLRVNTSKWLALAKGHGASFQQKQQIRRIATKRMKLLVSFERIFSLYETDRVKEDNHLFRTSVAPEFNRVFSLLNSIADESRTILNNELDHSSEALTDTHRSLIVNVVLAIIIVIILFIIFTRMVTRPIEELITVTKKISAGDLTTRIHRRASDELGLLAEAFNNMSQTIYLNRQKLEQNISIITESKEELELKSEQVQNQKNQIEKSFKNSILLSEFGQEITSILDIEHIVDLLHELTSSIMDVSGFGIAKYNSYHKAMMVDFFYRDGKKVKPFDINIRDKNSLTAYCFNTGSVVFINDVEKDINKYVKEPSKGLSQTGNQSLIHIPLVVTGKTFGVLIVNSKHKNAYTDENLTSLQTLASYTSIALDNAEAYRQVNVHNNNIKSAINYGKTIQQALLPTQKNISKVMDCGVIFRPRDIVSGDFMWMSNPISEGSYDDIILAGVDCTGHGVPGAFMSMLGHSFLGEIVNENKIYDTAEILHKLDDKIRNALKQQNGVNDDGMDMTICRFRRHKNDKSVKVEFTGAKSMMLLYKYKDKEIVIIKGDRKSIGGMVYIDYKFTKQEFILSHGDTLYLFTDGIVDQCNKLRKRFSATKLKEMMPQIADLSAFDQTAIIEKVLDEHSDGAYQRDDITFIALKA